ncbi:hypothetical protein M758_6G082000 [Ceratodon purpureus]|nr:hypothetical protein M758_6G082000 [Ceratodon purpureus]
MMYILSCVFSFNVVVIVCYFVVEVEEVMRSVEVALKRHTQLIETLIRSGVKIAHNNSSNSPGGSDDGFCDSRGDQRCSSEPRNGSPTPSGADEAGTSKL